MGIEGKCVFNWPNTKYSFLKSCPHCEMQCASSMAKSESCICCRNCMNCKTSDSQNKIYCIVCNNPYHEGCIHDVIKSTNQLKDP